MDELRAISLFTGAGGLDLGFEAAGFRTSVAVEFDSECASTIRANRDWPVLEGDIHDVPSEEILRVGGLAAGEADVLIGGPPCQPFSKSGYWATGETLRLDDPRAGTLEAYLRVLRDARPRAFLLENVEGIAYQGKGEALDHLHRTIRRINKDTGTRYSFAVGKLNAADYGVPQLRERVFIIGARDGLQFSFPPPTHAPEEELQELNGLEAHRTAWDALGDLTTEPSLEELQLTGKWADLLPSIPEGENYLWHTDRKGGLSLFGWRRRFWSFLLKLAKDKPSWTIQAQPGPATGPFHWENRRLSAQEMCRIQTFPDDFSVKGDLRAVQKQLGNAVPSALAEVLARAIRQQLFHQRIEQRATTAPPRRVPVPAPEKTQPVPDKYRELVGDHDPHPGTGQGFAAECREPSAVYG